LEKKRGAASVSSGVAAFRHAIGDFCNFQDWICFGLDALQFTGAVERRNPLAEIVKRQRIPLWVTVDYKGLQV
jgi:hypothetical protein